MRTEPSTIRRWRIRPVPVPVPVLSGGQPVDIVSRRDVIALMATEWVCEVCGEPIHSEQPPTMCPKCHAGSDRFALPEQSPDAGNDGPDPR